MKKLTLVLVISLLGVINVSAATPVFGTIQASVDRMYYFGKSKGTGSKFTREIAQLYYDLGTKYGIRGDIALCQSFVETGWFKFTGSVIQASDNNFCGLGATDTYGHWNKCTFSTPALGIEAQMQHLWAYATTKSLPSWATLVDPRFDAVRSSGKRGKAPNWENFGSGMWASASNYASTILSIYNEMMRYTLPVSLTADKTSASLTAYKGASKPTVQVKISASGLSSDISYNSSTSAFEVTASNWNARTGGTLTIALNTSREVGSYTGYVKVQSGSYSVTINLTGTIKEPLLSFSEGWNCSETKSSTTKFGWDATKIRNFCYHAGKLYCVYDHKNIKVINAQTGADLGNLNLSSVVTGGTYTLCDVKCLSDGHIVACNLAKSGQELRVYAWDNDQSAPYLLYSTTNMNGASRLGDCIEVSGEWLCNLVLTFAFDTGTETDILEFKRNCSGNWTTSKTKVTTDGSTQYAIGATPRAYTHSTGWWIDGLQNFPAWTTYDSSSNSAVVQCKVNTGEPWGSSHHEFSWRGMKYAVNLKFSDRVSGNSTSTFKGGRMRVIVDDSGNFSTVTQVGEYPSGGLGTTRNTNGTGDVHVNTDGSSFVEAWVLSTLQGFAYYKYGSVPTNNPGTIGPLKPRLSASVSSLKFNQPAWTTAKKTFTVSGNGLEGDIKLSISGSPYFKLSQSTISKSAGSGTIEVTYYPDKIGTHTATINITSTNADAISISLSGEGTWPQVVDDDVKSMTQVWNSMGNGSVKSWMSLSDNYYRSMAYSNGKIYALHAAVSTAPEIKIVDAYNGNLQGSLNVTGISTGLFYLSDIVAVDGKILACNIPNSSTPFMVYQWDSDSATPKTIISDSNHGGDATNKWCGAQMSVSGNLTNGRIWITNQGCSEVYYYTISNGSVSQTSTKISLTSSGSAFAGGDGRGAADIVYNADGTFWYSGKATYPTLFSASGVAQKTMNGGALGNVTYGTALDMFNFGEKKYLAATTYKSAASSANVGFVLIDVTNGAENAETYKVWYPESGLGSSANDQRVTSVCHDVRNGGGTLDIWVGACKQGIAYYTYSGGKNSAVSTMPMKKTEIISRNGQITLAGAEARRITVYSMTGAIVADVVNANYLDFDAAKGLYIVKAVDVDGNVTTKKIMM